MNGSDSRKRGSGSAVDAAKVKKQIEYLERQYKVQTETIKDQKKAIERYAAELKESQKALRFQERASQKLAEDVAAKKGDPNVEAEIERRVNERLSVERRKWAADHASSGSAAAADSSSTPAPSTTSDQKNVTASTDAKTAAAKSSAEISAAEKAMLQYVKGVITPASRDDNRAPVVLLDSEHEQRRKADRDQPSDDEAAGPELEQEQQAVTEIAAADGEKTAKKVAVDKSAVLVTSTPLNVQLVLRMKREIALLREDYLKARHEVFVLKAAIKKLDAAKETARSVTDAHATEKLQLQSKLRQVMAYMKKV